MVAASLAATLSWQLIVLAVLLVGSAFFSGSETALFSLSRRQMHELSGGLIEKLLSRPRKLLNTLLLGNMLVNVGFSASSASLVLDIKDSGAPTWAVVVSSAAPLVLIILFGEVTPKMLAFGVAPSWCKFAAGPIFILQKILAIPLWFLDRTLVGPFTKILSPRAGKPADITPEELTAMMDLSAKRGMIDKDVNSLLQEVVELTDLQAGDVMIPRVDMITFDINQPRAKLHELFTKTHLKKVPVIQNDQDNILGILSAKRFLLNPDKPLRKMITPVSYVPEYATLEKVLVQLRATRRQLAIVVDEYGGTAGLITLEDVIEEIVGDIGDFHDSPAPLLVRQVGKSQYILSGDLPIRDWIEAFEISLPAERISTLGGFITTQLGTMPVIGDVVTYRNLRFTVETMRGKRVRSINLTLIEGDSK